MVKKDGVKKKKSSISIREIPIKHVNEVFVRGPEGRYEATHSIYRGNMLLLREGKKIGEDRYFDLKGKIEGKKEDYYRVRQSPVD